MEMFLGDCIFPEGVEEAPLSDFRRLSDVMLRAGLVKSLTEARTLLKNNAVSLRIEEDEGDLKKVDPTYSNPIILIGYTYILKVGKKRWCKVKLLK